MAAALCYAIPVVGSLYVFARARSNAFLRLHAIQSVAVYGLLVVVAKLLDLFQPLTPIELPSFVTAAGFLLLIALAVLAYRGKLVKLPWIGNLVERWQGPVSKLVDGGIEQWQEYSTLAMHRKNLRGTDAAAARDVLPKVAGTRGMNGFEQRIDNTYTLDAPTALMGAVLVLLAVIIAITVGKRAFGAAAEGGLAGAGGATGILELLFLVGFASFLLYLIRRRVIARRGTGAELVVEHWPLRLGDQSRFHYRASSRAGGKVERIAANLRCTESILWQESDSISGSRGGTFVVSDVASPAVLPVAAADASVAADWTIQVPAQAPPSFASRGGGIAWQFVVQVRVAGAADSTHAFDLLVLPERLAQ